jgi:hypothetical protein
VTRQEPRQIFTSARRRRLTRRERLVDILAITLIVVVVAGLAVVLALSLE